MRRILLVAGLIASLAPSLVWGQAAVTNTPLPWAPNPTANASNPYTITTGSASFSLPAFSSSPGPISVNFCNTGSNPAFVVMGTTTATTGNSLVAAGICKLIARGSATTFSAITTGGNTTLNAETGNGSPQSAVPGSGGGSGGAVPALVANSVLATDSTPAMSWVTTLPSALTYPAATVTGSFTATGLVTLADVATQATNTVLGNATSGTASPTALAVGSCSTAASALIWTTNTGFGCNTSITATTNANLTGPITSSGNATSIASQTGTGSKFVVDTSPTISTSATFSVGGSHPVLIANLSGASTFSCISFSGGCTNGTDNGLFGGGDTGIYLSAQSGGTVHLRQGSTDIQTLTSTATTFSGQMINANLTTGTNADTVCLKADGTFLIQAAACTISSLRFKKLIPEATAGLEVINRLDPIVFTMKPGSKPNPDNNYGRKQIGLSAENVAAIEPRCAIYEDDGLTPKSYRQECLIAVLVKGMKEQQTEIADLKRQIRYR